MVYRIYTQNNLGLGQSGTPFPYLMEQTGSGSGAGSGFRTFGPLSDSGSYGGGVLNPVITTESPTVAATPLAKHIVWNFDTIGQTIYRFIGHVRVPLKIIWAAGLMESGDELVSDTQTFAGALGMPLDPNETGELFGLWITNTEVFNEEGVLTPEGWSDEDSALLANSLANMTIYPGDEAQMPDPRIVADKGADKANAFRGIRYIVFPDFPINGGGGGPGGTNTGPGNIPQLSVTFKRTNEPDEPPEDGDAVEFLAGSD